MPERFQELERALVLLQSAYEEDRARGLDARVGMEVLLVDAVVHGAGLGSRDAQLVERPERRSAAGQVQIRSPPQHFTRRAVVPVVQLPGDIERMTPKDARRLCVSQEPQETRFDVVV